METVSIRNTTRGSQPRVPFEAMARTVLGTEYTLSLVLCGDDLARRVNREYRSKDHSPNVLSFPISQTEGEIFVNVRKASREAAALGITPVQRIAHLFVHGCYHLQGMDHSDAMDTAEDNTLRQFKFL